MTPLVTVCDPFVTFMTEPWCNRINGSLVSIPSSQFRDLIYSKLLEQNILVHYGNEEMSLFNSEDYQRDFVSCL